ncbi:dna polymerase iii subunit gamma tau : DNA polymerase III gamma and tau subunits OS=Blastopirellula marina DSM 3645 GN=DSM3645_28667 PE=4 SV=1: DNA_pol3_delta2: DNA_pol3_gamma3 [Gemmata massiliana]|uniref:DNA polymerase III subunit gamma/tau n=1 Tax=Gemmata massiliana TaxID=1210884 RepID=A0A6P2D389_9BACT|nr:DNA polymerase III subunit gamma/tau [Gemmata massiliana]VTR94885.1 dna polymerase iii subunit gamma tau : DNA polymerase III gamma and tau subunits OS=Blastopirellula marina DSM 3645 GN=DSM3645_28667 PE=4 SV=1: DNA_pol3_delta2: DNA_pol3_gamma3 [Gemmata massiliana]
MSKSKPISAPDPGADAPAYTVVARRYRPQQFAELIGQEHVANALVNALKSGRVAHAYLFTGARGVGKTSAARILAKALNCMKSERPTATPCDECDSCRAVMTGDDVDVLEIDGASNNKVEEVRDLRQNVGFRPARGRYKIYIIDEVHMLSTSAFNALLKTLEEPPEHVKFILATTEVQKIPITILSRCQRFDFAHVGPAKIFDQLKRIVEREGHLADDDALRLVARRAAGSMRDSQSLLDQLLASAQGKLTTEQVSAVLGTAADDRVIELARAVIGGDARAALDLIAAWVDRGLQIGELVDQLVEYWRALMLVSCGGPEVRELPVSPNQFEAVKTQSQSVSLDTILAGLEVLTATKARMRGSAHTQVLLEMAVVRLCRLGDLRSLDQLVQALSQPGVQSAVVATGAGTPAPTRAPAAAVPVAAEAAKKNGPLAGALTAKPAENGSPNNSTSTIPLSESTLQDVWNRFYRYAGERYPILAKHLNSVSSYAISAPNSLVIRFPSSYSESHDTCSAETGSLRLADALKKVTGQTIALRFERDRAPNSQPLVREAQPSLASRGDVKQLLPSLPLFKKALDLFGAQIRQVDDGFNPFAAPPKEAETKEGTDEEG